MDLLVLHHAHRAIKDKGKIAILVTVPAAYQIHWQAKLPPPVERQSKHFDEVTVGLH